MKRAAIIIVQFLIVLKGAIILALLVFTPLTEGRAKTMDLFAIYSDPLILFVYASSIFFFIALYKAFRLVGYIGQNKTYSFESVSAFKSIKNCSILLCVLIIGVGTFIKFSHHEDDDPAGFLALCILATVICFTIAVVAAKFEMKVKNVLNK